MKTQLSYLVPPELVVAFVLFVVVFVGLRPAFASDSGACYNISSADGRAYCLAKAHKDPGRCYSIQDSGLRSMCLAEVRR